MSYRVIPRVIAMMIIAISMLVGPHSALAGVLGEEDPQLPPDPLAGPPAPPDAGFVDELLPVHAAITPADFEGVFSTVKLSDITSEKQVEQRLDTLDQATTAAEVAAVVPALAYEQNPEVIAFIEHGTLPPALTVRTGESVPPAPAAGGALLPGYPAPYGFYTSNPTNNWGMPNSPTGGCGPLIIRGDGLYFDFTRACRQHDLAYRWTPVQRYLVDNRLLQEMLYDCSLRGPVSSRLCAVRALVYWAATSILGGPSYGTPTPGYNTPGDPVVWPVPYTSCAQASHAWVYTDGFGGRVPRNKPLYFTGVVRQYSRVRFRFIDTNGAIALEHMTHAAYTNCVIRHEPERVSASVLPNGVYRVRALFTPWETEQVTDIDLGTIEIYTPTGSTSCNQFSHAWVHGTQGPITVGTRIYPTGVVRRQTSVRFDFVNAQGQTAYQHTTRPAANNCVIAHEPEVRSTAGWVPGQYQIFATYTEWETDQVVTRMVGNLDLRAAGGGGGGGGGCAVPHTTCE